MSESIPKTWVALGRRSEHGLPLDFLWELCLQRLVDATKSGPLQGVMLPPTVVYRPADQVRWFFTSEQRGIIEKKRDKVNSTAIRRAMMISGAPEGPVAVWHSERKDAKGYLYTQEFLDERGLNLFLKQRRDRGRCGVLQRFILPKDIKGKEGVNHELLVVSDAYLTIERRFSNIQLEPSKLYGLTQQSCVHPCLATAGKINMSPCSLAAPYTPAETSVGNDEIQSSALLAVLCPVMRDITERFSTMRHGVLHDISVPPRERSVSCLFKVDRENQLWLLGFACLKTLDPPPASDPVSDWVVPDFELLKRRKKVVETEEHDKSPEFVFSVEQPSAKADAAGLPPRPSTARVAPTAAGAEGSMRPGTSDRPRRTGSARSAQVPDTDSKKLFVCPNCNAVVPKSSAHTTTYLSILRYHDRRTRQQVKAVRGALQRGLRDTLRNPSSPLNSTEAAAFYDTSHNWVSVPHVLERLSKGIEEIRESPTWLRRQTPLCGTCYLTFFDSADENEQLQACYEAEVQQKAEFLDRKIWDAKYTNSDRPPPEPIDSLVNDMVFTPLQHHHKTVQVKTRAKLLQRRVLQSAAHRVPTAAEDAPHALTLLETLASNASAAGGGGGAAAAASVPHPPRSPRAPLSPASKAQRQPQLAMSTTPVPPPSQLDRPPGYTRVAFGPLADPITSSAAAEAAAAVPAAAAAGKRESAAAPAAPPNRDDSLGSTEQRCYDAIKPEGAVGTEFESSAAAILSSYLYEGLAKQLQFGCVVEELGEDGCPVEDVPAKHALHAVYCSNRNRIPAPEQRVVISVSPHDPALAEQREKGLLSALCGNIEKQICDTLPLFKEISPEEQVLLSSVISQSYHKEKEKQQSVLKKKDSVGGGGGGGQQDAAATGVPTITAAA